MPLTPEEKTLFQQLQAKAGTGLPQPEMDQMPAPGSFKDNPEGAIEFIRQRATGQQLSQLPSGQLAKEVPSTNPLKRLFGGKDKLPVNSPNYLDSIQKAGLTQFLPTGLPRTPEGTPFINEATADQIKQIAAQKKLAPNDPGIEAFGTAFLSQRGSPEQVAAWKNLSPETKAALASSLPGFSTARQDYFSPQGIITDAEGKPSGVSYNAKTGEYEVKPLPTGGVIPAKGRAATSEEVDFFAKAETLNNVMRDVSKLYSDDKVGPFAGRVGRAIDVYTPFTNQERSALRNNVAKMFNNMVYLRSGKQINQEEAARMAEEFMNTNNTPGAFKTAFDTFQNEFVWLVDNRRKSLKQGLVANADRFASGIKADERFQLDGTKSLDSFLGSYDQKNKTNYGMSSRDQAQAATEFLKSRKARITPANLKWAEEQMRKQNGRE